jgi:hypothetical protein
MANVGETEPQKGKADIFWDEAAELWHCRTCKQSWLRNGIARCRCENSLPVVFQDGVN